MSIENFPVSGELIIKRRGADNVLVQVLPEFLAPLEIDPAVRVRADLQPLTDTETYDAEQLMATNGIARTESQGLVKFYIGGNDENPATLYDPEVGDRIFYADTTGNNPLDNGVYSQLKKEHNHRGSSLDYRKLICYKTKQTFAGFEVP